MKESTGYVYCPPEWDLDRLLKNPEIMYVVLKRLKISEIAYETVTDIYYIKSKHSLQITGDANANVYQAQVLLNNLFSSIPQTSKSKHQWIRPDKPGGWGQRRDGYVSNLSRTTSQVHLLDDVHLP
jgi:hypothetical protein